VNANLRLGIVDKCFTINLWYIIRKCEHWRSIIKIGFYATIVIKSFK